MSATVSSGTFRSADADCRARIWRPESRGQRLLPCIVMAHGFSLTVDDGLTAFAERFATAGFIVVAFDFRHLGASDGEPRQYIDYGRQRADLQAAVDFARQLDHVDPRGLAVWGFSVAGGLALYTAAHNPGIAAAVCLSPMLDPLAFGLRSPRNAAQIVADAARELITRRPHPVPAVAPAGSYAVLASDEAVAGISAIRGSDSLWRNEALASPFLTAARFRPTRAARRVRCPLLICTGDGDTLAPRPAIETVLARAPHAERCHYPFGHFDGFVGTAFDQVVTDQLQFLTRHLLEPLTSFRC